MPDERERGRSGDGARIGTFLIVVLGLVFGSLVVSGAIFVVVHFVVKFW